jgi:tRNA-specific adenosine deaminase 2
VKFGGCGGVLNVHVANGATELQGEGGDGEDGAKKGRGVRKRHEDDYEASGGWLREEAILLLRRFYVQENGRAPEPRRRGKEERVVKVDVEPFVEGKKKGG